MSLHHIVSRYRYAADLEQVQDALESLKALDANLTSIEDAFDVHFKTATLAPEVQSQVDVVTKSMEGLKAAKAIQQQAEAILKLFPEDKAGARAKAEADRMVERFQKHEQAARNIIKTISKKTMPAALKKEGAIAEKLIRARLVNPDGLKIIPWQVSREVWVTPTTSYGRGSYVKVAEHQVVFKLEGGPEQFGMPKLFESSGTLRPGVFGVLSDYSYAEAKPMTGKEFAAAFLQGLRGWPGVRGEAEATAGRASVAKGIASALDSAISRMRTYDSEAVEVSPDNLRISGAYRSDLPKGGASDVGAHRYEEMVEHEIASFRKVLDPKLAPYKDQIAKVSIHDGEKSWIYTDITLK